MNKSRIISTGSYLLLSGIAAYLGDHGNVLMRNYGFDTALAGLSYSIYHSHWDKMTTAAIVFTGCSLAEIIQSFDLTIVKNHPLWIGSVYDPKDFLAYAIGIGSALVLDTMIERLSRPKSVKSASETDPPRQETASY